MLLTARPGKIPRAKEAWRENAQDQSINMDVSDFCNIFAWGKSAASENKRSDNARFLPEVTMDLCFNLKLKFQFRCLPYCLQ